MLNLTKVFFSSSAEAEHLHGALIPDNEQRAFLRTCRTIIKDYLKPAIAEATVTVLGMEKQVQPRFRTQGSLAYNTCIQPAHPSDQQMDLDYGVYLPVDVWQENGPPEAMAKLYFDLVESLLQILCVQEGWTLVTDDEAKDTCIRINVATWAHIDIPLYAAPAEDFKKVVERTAILKSQARSLNSIYGGMALDSAEVLFAEAQTWEDLDQIVMASRTGKWKPSDPETVAKWFRDQITRFGELGEQFLRTCRYVKAWRDYNWKTGGPTSVSLMIAIAQGFEGKKGRDDIALEHAAAVVAQAVREGIKERGIDGGEEDFNRLKRDERIEAGLAADRLVNSIRSARNTASYQSSSALQSLRTVFGDRIPFCPELIQEEAPASIVRSTAPAIVAVPYVPNTSAG
nr:CBASS cGAMP synthase [uncultured Pseudomonas sp.]